MYGKKNFLWGGKYKPQKEEEDNFNRETKHQRCELTKRKNEY